MFYVLVALLAALPTVALSASWQPYDADAERARMVTGVPQSTVNHLEPAPQIEHSDCVAAYWIEPSFDRVAGWCVLQAEEGYELQSWELGDSTPGSLRQARESQPKRVALPTEIVALLAQIWTNVLLDTRYPRSNVRGADGDVHRFAAFVRETGLRLDGEAWSPRAEAPPKWIAEAGQRLLAFARTDGSDTVAVRDDLKRTRDKVFRYYKSRRRHGA